MLLSHEEAINFMINFGIAGTTSVIAKTTTAPFERVKLILQNQNSALQILTGQRQHYKGIIDCFRRIPREQGIRSLWRGNGINIIRYFPTQALNFAFYDCFKTRLYRIFGKDSLTKLTFTKFLAGGTAGACSTAVVYPLDFCQTRISLDMGSEDMLTNKNKVVEREFNGIVDCFKKIIKAEGYRGLYKGFDIAIIGVTVYRASYFGLFDLMKGLWGYKAIYNNQEVPKPPFLVSLMFAQLVTSVAGAYSYPFDTVGRRLMLEAGRPKELRLFHNSWGAFKHMYVHEGGIKTFYKGVLVNCLRGMSGAIVLVLYDEILYYTNWKEIISKS